MDINKTTHTGVAATNPTYSTINESTPMAVFTLKVREQWQNKSGQTQHRDNLIRSETLGKNAHWVMSNVKAGKKYLVDGYIRFDVLDGVEVLRIRSFSINVYDSLEFDQGKRIGYLEGLIQAFKIVKESDTLDSAKMKLEVLAKSSS